MQDDIRIGLILKKIKRLKSFKPSAKVNEIFSKLVNIALSPNEKIKLPAKDIKFLQKSAAKAEYELEKYWAQKITNNKNDLYKFPYYENYVKLTRIEWNTLLSCKFHSSHNVLFLGSGPLPLTGIILAKIYGCNVTLLDISNEAINISKNIIKGLNLSNISFVNSDALDFNKYKKFDVIYLAALAGIDSGVKKKIIDKIRKESSENVHLVVRSSFGNREILYKPIKKKDLNGFKLEVEVKPHNDIVNSFLILKK